MFSVILIPPEKPEVELQWRTTGKGSKGSACSWVLDGEWSMGPQASVSREKGGSSTSGLGSPALKLESIAGPLASLLGASLDRVGHRDAWCMSVFCFEKIPGRFTRLDLILKVVVAAGFLVSEKGRLLETCGIFFADDRAPSLPESIFPPPLAAIRSSPFCVRLDVLHCIDSHGGCGKGTQHYFDHWR